MTESLAKEADRYLRDLFPITRSLTGEGNRETLKILQQIIPINIKEYPSGLDVYDWVIPSEWNISDAWIKDESGKRLIDFNQSNLHVLSYSEPVNQKMGFQALQGRLHYLEDLPEAIPYRTSYYERDWGFCVSKSQFKALKEYSGEFEVVIDSGFKDDGSLTVGEFILPGKSNQEILVSTYICHPSLANDNLTGPILTSMLARDMMAGDPPNYTWRFIYVPETIGAIAYCAQNEQKMKAIDCGFVITSVGGKGNFGYKKSFDASHSLNSIVEDVLDDCGSDYITYPFDIHGSDERQYSSIGFRINTVSITKDKYYEYPEYHTSLDNLDNVSGESIVKSLVLYQKVSSKLDKEIMFKNQNPNCEVMLSKHELYPPKGGAQVPKANGKSELDLSLWLLWYCDGKTQLSTIARELDVELDDILKTALILEEKKLLLRL